MIDHEARRKSIGASEIAAVLGCNEYMTPMDVWLVKTGREPPFAGNEHTQAGQDQESGILKWLQRQLGNEFVIIQELPPLQLAGTIATATPDGVIVPENHLNLGKGAWQDILEQFDKSELCLVEAKSTLRRVGCVADIPMSFLMQTQWQMGVTGIPHCKLVIFGPSVRDYEYFDIEFNPELFAEMLAKASEWWEKHVVGDVIPTPINSDDAYRIWPQDDGSAADVSEAVYRDVCELKAIREQIKTLKERDDALLDRIKIAGQAAKELWYAGVKIATLNTIEPKPETKIREQRKPYRELRLKI